MPGPNPESCLLDYITERLKAILSRPLELPSLAVHICTGLAADLKKLAAEIEDLKAEIRELKDGRDAPAPDSSNS
ncbi:MAG: hypothetical protein LBQ79_10600, partial [Deltaproteobacteria bacterium]|nr:hypothetical protein [Deltaproteobacteria bacterium]